MTNHWIRAGLKVQLLKWLFFKAGWQTCSNMCAHCWGSCLVKLQLNGIFIDFPSPASALNVSHVLYNNKPPVFNQFISSWCVNLTSFVKCYAWILWNILNVREAKKCCHGWYVHMNITKQFFSMARLTVNGESSLVTRNRLEVLKVAKLITGYFARVLIIIGQNGL